MKRQKEIEREIQGSNRKKERKKERHKSKNNEAIGRDRMGETGQQQEERKRDIKVRTREQYKEIYKGRK